MIRLRIFTQRKDKRTMDYKGLSGGIELFLLGMAHAKRSGTYRKDGNEIGRAKNTATSEKLDK
jgi:hypothetical protein